MAILKKTLVAAVTCGAIAIAASAVAQIGATGPAGSVGGGGAAMTGPAGTGTTAGTGLGSTRTTGPAGTTGGINSTLNNSLPGSNTPANNDIGRSGIGANSNIGSSTLGSNGIGSSVTGNMTGAQLAQNNIGPNSPAGTASSAAANTAIPAAPPWPVQVRFLAVAQRLARWNPPSRCCGRPPHRPSCRAD